MRRAGQAAWRPDHYPWLPRRVQLLDENQASYGDLLDRVRQTGRLAIDDADMPQAWSEDSYEHFYRRNWAMCRSYEEELAHQAAWEHRAAKHQREYEERRRAEREAADRQWDAEGARRALEAMWIEKHPSAANMRFLLVRVHRACVCGGVRLDEGLWWVPEGGVVEIERGGFGERVDEPGGGEAA